MMKNPNDQRKLSFFQKVIEGSPLELKTILASEEDAAISAYGEVLHLYRLSKTLELSQLLPTIRDSLVYALATLRLQIRKREVSLEQVTELESTVKTFEGFWHGEIYFVLALAAEVLDDQKKAQVLYLKAQNALEDFGFLKKAVGALLNATACESRIHPDGKFISDYQYILQKALNVKDNATVGIALVNIAREYQKLGALNIALEYCDRALEATKLENGTQQFDLIVAQRAHLLLALNRLHEAEICLEHLKTSPFSEVKEAVNVLLKREIEYRNLLPTWKERLEEDDNPLEFSNLEQSLMELICETPLTREEIIEKLYGTKADYSTLENRFFNLINRIDKKHPGLIYREKNLYGLSDRSFLTSLRLAK